MKIARKKGVIIFGSVLIAVSAMLLVYFILIATGVVRVRANDLTFSTSSATKIYDGNPVEAHEFSIVNGVLPEGYTVIPTFTSSLVEPGSCPNEMSVVILNDKGTDVTKEFEIDYEFGTLAVNPITLTVSTGNADKIYDGTPLLGDADDWNMSEGSLLRGHSVTAVMTGTITNVGEVPNTVTCTVTDTATGEDVTRLYSFSYDLGTLRVIPRDITLSSASADKEYDGTPLEGDPEVTADLGSLVPGHTLEAYASASITGVGSVPNTIYATIYDADGMNVTSNYNIIKNEGTLTVTPVIVADLTSRPTYDGELQLSVRSDRTGTVYLRSTSYGDYLSDDPTYGGAVWLASGGYSSSGGVNPVYYTSEALKNGGWTGEHTLDVVAVNGGYWLPYYTTDGPEGQGNDYKIVGAYDDDATRTYTLAYYDYDFMDLYDSGSYYYYSVPSSLSEAELEYSEYVYSTYLDVPSSIRQSLYDYAVSCGMYGNDDIATIYLVANYFLNFGTYDLYYPDVPDGEDLVLYFLSDGRGICRHYASAATLVLRTLGVPARYVSGYAASVARNEWTELTSEDAHAWVEVYLSGMGWVKLEVTNGFDVIDPDNVTLEIYTKSVSKLYDGEPLTAPDYGRYAGILFDGHTIVPVEWTSITDPGTVTNYVTYAVYNAAGEDVTDMYDMIMYYGYLEIREPADTGGGGSGDGNREEWGDGEDCPPNGLSPDIGSGGGDDNMPGDATVAYVTSSASGTVYLRYASYGDYLGNTWSTVTDSYTSGDGYNMFYLTYEALASAGREMQYIGIELADGVTMYLLPYYSVSNEYTANDTVITGNVNESGEGMYSFWYFSELGNVSELIGISNAGYEEAYREFVYSEYLSVPEQTRQVLDDIISGQGFSYFYEDMPVSEYLALVNAVAEYISSSYTYDAYYDRIPEGVTDYVTYFLTVSKEGVCNHFASAATLLYRELGIPARFVTGFSVSAEADMTTAVTAANAHAWVEVYINGLGWVQVEVTGSSFTDGDIDSGIVGEDDKTDLIVYTGSADKIYDGTPLTCYEIYDVIGLNDGHEAYVYTGEDAVNSSRTEIGIADNYLDIRIVDTVTGADVTYLYDVTQIPGILEVYPRTLTVTTGSDEKEYDGTPLTCEEYTYDESRLLPGHTLTLDPDEEISSITEPGDIDNVLYFIVTDETGADVTYLYDMTVYYGTLTVASRQLTVTTGSDEKEYDGTPLTCEEYTYDESKLLPGHSLSLDGSVDLPSITEPGSIPNELKFIITDEAGTDVSKYYDISISCGTLTVTKRTLEITTGSDEKEYDGTPLTCEEYTYDENVLLPGHTLTLDPDEEIASVTEPGSISNVLHFVIADSASGADVTHCYEIVPEYGTLTVISRTITVETGSAEKEYDGGPLTCYELVSVSGTLSYGHEVYVYTGEGAANASRTEPGSTANELDIRVRDEITGEDVTSLYMIEQSRGTLTVTKRTLEITTGSDKKEYDGTPLTCEEYTYDENALLSSHMLLAEGAGQTSITEPGAVANVFAGFYVIDTATGKDVSDTYYDITVIDGTLKVTQRALVITTDSDSKEYDGDPLTCHDYDIAEGTLAGGHEIDVDPDADNASITDPGSIPNKLYFIITDSATGEDVTHCYDIERIFGTLTVFAAGSGEGGEGGGNFEGGAGVGAPGSDISQSSPDISDPATILYVTSSVSGTVYLRYQSNGVYEGTKWSATEPYSGSGYNMLYLVYDALAQSGMTTDDIKIGLDGGSTFLLPYYSKSNMTSYDDTLVIGDINADGENTYSLGFFSSLGDITKLIGISNTELEQAYRSYVYENYMSVPAATAAVLDDIISEKGFTRYSTDMSTSEYIALINAVAEYISTAYTYNLDFAPIPDDVTDYVTYFLTVSREGICNHFASAATLLYRELGIPARYVTGYMANATEGVKTAVTSGNGHAWVEVYINGLGWVQVEVTGSPLGGGASGDVGIVGDGPDEGGEDQEKTDITVYTGSVTDEYDGEPLECHKITHVSGLAAGHEAYVYEGDDADNASLTEIGSIENILDIRIRDTATGEDVTGSYNIVQDPGTIRVVARSIEITTGSAVKDYDGEPLECGEFALTSGSLLEGHSLVLDENAENASLDHAGTMDNVLHFRVFDGEDDVTEKYDINCVYGTLTLNGIKLTINSDGYEWTYDGQAHSCSGFTVTYGEVLSGHSVKVVESSVVSVTRPTYDPDGELIGVENALEYKIVDEEGNDVTAGYEINAVPGTLMVTPRTVTVTTDNAEKVYDGTPLTCSDYTFGVVGGGLLTDHKETAGYFGRTDVGIYDNIIPFTVTDASSICDARMTMFLP